MVRVLQMVGVLQKGGMETFIMDVYKNIDRSKVQFDFVVHGNEVHDFEPEILELGGKVYHISRKTEGFFKHYMDLFHVVKNNGYKIIVRSTENAISAMDLLAAKAGGAKHLISHSHNGMGKSKKAIITNYLGRPLINRISTEKYACSNVAGKWLYGNKKFEVINNGRDLKVFTFDENVRKKTRAEMGISQDTFVVVSIARFNKQKNHKRIISIFNELQNTRKDSLLLLVGRGELETEIREEANRLQIRDKVYFAGVRNDVSELLQASDALLMPSFYEGLPLTIVEAQATGLPCFLSDTITDEVVLSDCVFFKSLNDDDKVWVQEILEKSSLEKRYPRTQDIKKAGYDIYEIAKKLEEHYLQISAQ